MQAWNTDIKTNMMMVFSKKCCRKVDKNKQINFPKESFGLFYNCLMQLTEVTLRVAYWTLSFNQAFQRFS